jgi:predicted RNase H-like HicB family nuclease
MTANGPLKYEAVIYWSEDDEAFVADMPGLAGCMSGGPTPAEALANGHHAGVDRDGF